MAQLSVTAPDISCEHCRSTIERELGGLPGVQTVSVDVPARRVDVTYDQSQVSPSAIITKLDDEGYPVQ